MHGRWRLCVLLGTLFQLVFGYEFLHESFEEELTIRPLRDGKVVSRFSFNTRLKDSQPRNPETLGLDDDESQHYTLFPLALGQILREYAVTELHLTLNAGKWNYDSWGYPEEPGVGTGAELLVWMGEGGPITVDTRWRGLRNALAGLFCASLASMDDQRTTSPTLAFSPEGSLPDWNMPHSLRHATLPSEHVCTENLTPFLKLLPCKSLSGIAGLLNPYNLFDTDWHGMGIHVLWDPDRGINVKMTFQLVSDPLRVSSQKKQDWSFLSLFDRTITRSCPVAQQSRILVQLPLGDSFVLEPEPRSNDGSVAIYDGTDVAESLNINLRWLQDFAYPLASPNPPLTQLSVQRVLHGSSQTRGQLSVALSNRSPSPIDVVYLETMPWLIQFFLHTMRISADDIPRDDLISDLSYIPPIPHARPATFQSIITLPAQTTVHITIDVTKSFLRYTEHPPDAQRGWDLPPAIVIPVNDSRKRIYTPILLADLATPDFSMPYNVIIFTCSLVAFIFGSIFNLLTRKFVVVRLQPKGEKTEEKPET